MTKNPKVFICHASEDKERFVNNFALKLRKQGIDAWLDKWELLLGDNLVERIFDEGIKNAQAGILIISKFSINKPFFRRELNTLIVKQIYEKIKIIPVILDNCDPPEALKSDYHLRINNIENYDDKIEEIINSVYQLTDKPPLGKPPTYVETEIINLSGLERIDTIVFKLSCEYALEIGHLYPIETNLIYQRANLLDISSETARESLEILEQEGYLKLQLASGNTIPFFYITNLGFEEYLITYFEDYDSKVKEVITHILNSEQDNNYSILKDTNINLAIVDHILKNLESKGYIKMREAAGGHISTHYKSPKLKRMLQKF